VPEFKRAALRIGPPAVTSSKPMGERIQPDHSVHSVTLAGSMLGEAPNASVPPPTVLMSPNLLIAGVGFRQAQLRSPE